MPMRELLEKAESKKIYSVVNDDTGQIAGAGSKPYEGEFSLAEIQGVFKELKMKLPSPEKQKNGDLYFVVKDKDFDALHGALFKVAKQGLGR